MANVSVSKKPFASLKSHTVLRPFIQSCAAFGSNSYIAGFIRGDIFKGRIKQVCVPGLNCYSCPGAAGACPVGAFQAVAGSKKFSFSFYVTGIAMLFGALFGRFVCGFLCPFGFFQDVLHRIPLPFAKTIAQKEKRFRVPQKLDTVLRFLKYAVLAVFVVALPALVRSAFGIGDPYFCKWVCPAGILEGALPLIAKNESLRNTLGFLFGWKTSFLALTVLTSLFLYRPFCKYVCPLGAFYSFFNKISLYRMHVDTAKCTRCGACERACRMHVPIIKPLKDGTFTGEGAKMPAFLSVDNAECIRCHDCKKACPCDAIRFGFDSVLKTKKAPENS